MTIASIPRQPNSGPQNAHPAPFTPTNQVDLERYYEACIEFLEARLAKSLRDQERAEEKLRAISDMFGIIS